MTPQQCRMARAGLKWNIDDLADEAELGRATVARFESGKTIDEVSLQKLKLAFARRRVKFVNDGPFKGAVYMGMRAS